MNNFNNISCRKSPLVVDFEIIGASNQETNDYDDFVVIAAVHDGNYFDIDFVIIFLF